MSVTEPKPPRRRKPTAKRKIVESRRKTSKGGPQSARQSEIRRELIIDHVVKGWSDSGIAEQLGITPAAVKQVRERNDDEIVARFRAFVASNIRAAVRLGRARTDAAMKALQRLMVLMDDPDPRVVLKAIELTLATVPTTGAPEAAEAAPEVVLVTPDPAALATRIQRLLGGPVAEDG